MSVNSPQEGDPALQAQQGLLLYGEGIAALTPNQIETLRTTACEMVGGLSIEAQAIVDVESVIGNATEEQLPVPADLSKLNLNASSRC